MQMPLSFRPVRVHLTLHGKDRETVERGENEKQDTKKKKSRTSQGKPAF